MVKELRMSVMNVEKDLLPEGVLQDIIAFQEADLLLIVI